MTAFDRNDIDDITILRIDGDLDDSGVSQLKDTFSSLEGEGRKRFVLNLSETRFISGQGVFNIVEKTKFLRETYGDLKLVGLNLYGERLFKREGVFKVFDVYQSEGEAVEAYQRRELREV